MLLSAIQTSTSYNGSGGFAGTSAFAAVIAATAILDARSMGIRLVGLNPRPQTVDPKTKP